MKMLKKKSWFTKATALLLSMILVTSTFISVFAAEETTPFSVVVMDKSTGVAISGASITITLPEGIVIDGLDGIVTNDEGKAEISAITDYFTATPDASAFDITCKVTATDYKELETTANIATGEECVEIQLEDAVAPVISNIEGNPTNWQSGNVTLTVKASDDAYKYQRDGGEWQDSASFEVSSNGTYVFYVKDIYENLSEKAEVIVEKLDNENPKIDNVTINPNTWTKEEATVTVSASDSQSGVVEYKMDEGEWQSEASFKVTDNKEHKFYVKDNVGNVSQDYIAQVQFDAEKPTIEGTAPDKDSVGYTNGDVTVTVTAKDIASADGISGASQVVAYACVPQGDTLFEDDDWQETETFTITDARVYVIYVKDAAGNISDVKEVQFDIDKDQPQIMEVTPLKDAVKDTKDNVEITVSATDVKESDYAESGIYAYAYVLTSEVPSDLESLQWVSANTFTIEDARSYSVYVKDVAGNISEAKEVQYDIDKDKPEITGITPAKEKVGFVNESVKITVSATDEKESNYAESGISAYACVLTSDVPENLENLAWVSASESTYEFTIEDARSCFVYVKDVAGNISDAKEVQFDIDKDKPEITEIIPVKDEVGFVNESVEIAVSATDAKESNYAESGISAYACVLTSYIPENLEDLVWVSSEATTHTFIIEDARNYSVYTRDIAGNISEAKTVQFDVDKCSPTYDGVEYQCDNGNAFATILNKLSFGLFFKSEGKFVVSARDVEINEDGADVYVESGIVGYKYLVKDIAGEIVYQTEDGIYESNEFNLNKIPENFKGTMQVTIYDNAGNEAVTMIKFSVDDDNELEEFIVENDAPIISNITPEKETITRDDFIYSFSVSEEHGKDWASGIAAVKVTVNETEFLLDDGLGEIAVNRDYALNVDVEPRSVTIDGTKIDKWNNGILQFVIEVCDNSGNYSREETVVYLDQTSPVVDGFSFSLTDNIDVESASDIYPAVIETVYGFYFKEDVDVTIYASDSVYADEAWSETVASGVQSITYKVVKKDGTIIAENTVAGSECTVTIPENFKGQILAFATDNVGNTPIDKVNYTGVEANEDGYIHPNGVIIESQTTHDAAQEEHVTIKVPETTYTQNNGKALYADDVDVKITIKDEFAGIRKVEWSVVAPYDTEKNYSGEFEVDNAGVWGDSDWICPDGSIDENLVTTLTNTITVSNDSNDIVVWVKMTDRSGNITEKEIVFGIDKTKPEITLEYDNIEPDEEYTDIYDANRTATITIKERNFRAEDVVFSIVNTDKVIPGVDLMDASVWKTTVDEIDPNKTIHKATIIYTNDGDYTFVIDYKDNVMNAATQVKDEFTIDKTIPKVTVEYDNNSAQNGNYYKAERTATITIKEHNFDSKRVGIIGSADEGSFPKASSWKLSEKDTYVATIRYTNDALYTFDIEVLDKAGNSIKDFKQQKFTVDKTKPVVRISGIVDESANNDDGNIGYIISATDKNFDVFTPVLTAVLMKDGEFATEVLDIGTMSNITKGKQYTVINIEEDGIYSITCTVVDKAGNAYGEVLLENAEGRGYVEKRFGTDKLTTFSVNRLGSTFKPGSYTQELTKTYYVKNVSENVTISEINVDPLTGNSVTLNGNALTENEDYTVTLENSKGTWYNYSYSFNKELFENEGEYNIVIASSDKATNEAFSDVKDAAIKFVVDRTAPAISVTGMKNNGRYQTDRQVVTIAPTDDGGMLKSLIIRTVDEDGNVIKELVNLSEDKLSEALATGNITFELGEALYQNVQIICEDYAGNITGSESGELYENISVSSSAFMIFWANKALRWGTIAGIVVLLALGSFLILRKKSKDEEA